MPTKEDVRPFLARLLGWASEETIDVALRSIDLAVDHRAHLVLQGTGDLVPIAQSLHRRVLGQIGRSSCAIRAEATRVHPSVPRRMLRAASMRSARQRWLSVRASQTSPG